ncbi:putative (+)-abscisic acid 8'-hydroxylase [Helianthus annuus]|nr:putative (+)-abscisic acid 8'-hydroxylase [Helianthus annuus]
MLNLKVAPKRNTFMPFGNGVHTCLGNELAKLEILVLMHHMTTKYRLVKCIRLLTQ